MAKLRKIALSLIFIFSSFSCAKADSPYSVNKVDAENRFMFNDKHFMTLIENGIFVLRPHPSAEPDDNAWGSSWYAQPFLPGAVLKHTNLESITIGNESITVHALGKISRGTNQTYGDWETTISLSYDGFWKRISGNGEYSISLNGLLSDSTGDLNLYKIASNYLDNVPLLGGGFGDTGDMQRADYIGDTFNDSWIPPIQPGHFPGTHTDNLSINVIGQYNNIDTAAQGYSPIAPAYKPSLKVELRSPPTQTGIHMIFGAIYDTSKSQDFWEDNVGITPLILKTSTQTQFNFDVLFESVPWPEITSAQKWNLYY